MKESLKTFAENISSAKQGSVHQHLQSQPGPTAMTNSTGIPIGDITHSLNINGHVLASDSWLMEKQQTFNRGKTVERMVHPCGSGAFGYFEVTKPDLSQYCKAKFLNSPGKQTPVFVRFSTVTLGKEFPDSARNPRGFAIKFYTEEGNYDLVGLNFPIFFVRDPALGPDVIRSQQRNPQNFLIDYNSWFDFASLVPESLHCFTMLFSDHGTPYGFRMMDGYGAHTFKWVNQAGEQFYVKYHLISENGKKNFAWDDAVKMCGLDPDFAKRDLFETLEKGQEQKWKMCVQIAPASKIHAYEKFDPFDVTKVWPKSEFPLMEIGRLVLNKNPENYHRDVEQACFSPGALVPGIEPSPDALLQFRMFLYRDAQFYRMGANLHQVPVNCPFRAMSCNPFTRDGQLRVDENGGMEAHYYPNSIGKVKPDKRRDMQPVFVSGVIDRKSHSKHSNNLEEEMLQVRELYLRVMDDTARDHLHYNISVALKFCKRDIQMRSLIMFYKAHPSYAKGVMEKMGNNCSISWNELEETAKKCPQLVDANNAYFLLSPNIGNTSEESSSSSSSSYKSGTNVSNQSHPAALATMS